MSTENHQNPQAPRSSNVVWHGGLISEADRQAAFGQRGCVVWLTGLSGSGKSTVARQFERQLLDAGRFAYVLDGDNVRHGLNGDLGFSADDRQENIRRLAEVAGLFADAGMIVITAFISPYLAGRALARDKAPAGRFVEVFLDTPLAVCESRDPKGLYEKARRGEIRDFTGINAPYEAPESPELTIRTDQNDPAECGQAIFAYLKETRFLTPESEMKANTKS